jgi:cephalosporin-C deacetylase-like acetyl esterase
MRKVFVFVLLTFSICAAGNNIAIYQEFLNDTAPTIIETVNEYTQDGVYVHKLKFLSRVSDGQNCVIYGILCKPVGAGPYPGLLNVHGGGGSADQMFPQVFDWAKLGYVAFCQDQPAMGGSSMSYGPFNSRGRWDVLPDATYSSLFDGVVAGLNGLRMIRSQPETDVNNVGVTGGSWGGYMTTMISGLAGDRIKASFSIYGCGYYDKGSYWKATIEALDPATRETWLDSLDAGRKASQIQSNFFLTSPSNDSTFWPSAMMATFNDITSPKKFAIAPNLNHSLSNIAGGTSSSLRGPHRTYMEIQWMNYHLKGIGDPFGCCTPTTVIREGNDVRVRFTYTGVNPEEIVSLWYSYGEPPLISNNWQTLALTSEGGGAYSGLIPVYEYNVELPISWFGSVQDILGADLREYTCSTTYQTIDPLDFGFRAEKYEHFNEGYINVTASEEELPAGRPAEKCIDGSGLDDSGLFHNNLRENNWTTGWTSGGGYTKPHPGTVPGNIWIAFEFDKAYHLGDLWIWNNNWNDTGDYTHFGLRNVTIEYSTTGGTSSSEWTKLGNFEFAKADGTAMYAHNTEVDFGGVEAKFVCITTHDTDGTWNAPDTGKHGLAEVRFFEYYYSPADLSDLSDHWLSTGTGLNADLYPDNKINFKDFAIMAARWLE